MNTHGHPHEPNALAALRTGGEVGADLLAVDWAATPLGPPETWPQSLTTVVDVLLSSRFSMWMAWGPELTFFCNDAYRRNTLGTKYPWALGRPARDVWAEIWPDIGPRIDGVLRTGEATWDEALQLFLERSGAPEETYHTFSYSPLADDDGAIVGMLCVVSEETERVIGESRLATVRDLGVGISAARTEEAVLIAAGENLALDPSSLPWTLVYVDGRLAATSGIDPSHPAAEPWWPFTDERVLVEELAFPELPTGAWDRPPEQALVLPLGVGHLVAAINPYRPFDDGYESFLGLVA